jgi:EAL domain-containing protein (putative c-di-GMP-specific phosphodiesterase class I)
MSFVQNLDTDSENRTLVQTIQYLSEGLNLKTVAEGIETREELKAIKEIGVNFGQGYLWSKPVPLNEFIKLI